MRPLRALLLVLGVVAAVATALAGAPELALSAAPFLILAGLLASGRYVGEARILARYAAHRPRRLRAARRLGRPVDAERALASLLERAPQSRRGPPAALPA